MRLLDRYLLRELLVPLFYCLSGFILLWICLDLFNGMNTFQGRRLHGTDIAEYYLIGLPEVLVIVLPMALLLALLYALTNHARHHEITAIRAAGISMWRLCVPYLGIGFFATILLFTLNEYAVPDSAEAADAILSRRVPKKAGELPRNKIANLSFFNNRDARQWQIGIYDLETAEMIRPVVISILPDKSRRWLYAERGIRKNGVWTFSNVSEYSESAEANSMLVPIIQTNLLAMPQFAETPDEIRSEVKLANAISTFSTKGNRKADIPISEIRNYLRLHPSPSRPERRWLYTKLHGRLATPWMCLVVVLIAIPFGAATGRRNVFVGVASSLVICFAYYVLQQAGLAFGASGWLPPWLGAWFPNIAFSLTGIWLTLNAR